MSEQFVKNDSVNISPNKYLTATVGAGVGGACAAVGTKVGGTILLDKTIKALNSNEETCDAFFKAGGKLLGKVSKSNKGFFGILNSRAAEVGSDAAVRETMKNYKDCAVKILKENFSGEALEENVKKLTEKFVKKDMQTSFKAALKKTNIAIIAIGAAVGLIGALAISKHRNSNKANQA